MNIQVYRGDSLSLDGVIKNQDGDIVNLTGGVIKFSVKKKQTDPTYIISKTCAITSPTEGKFNVFLSPTETAIPVGDYVYDIQLQFGAGSVYTVRKGVFTVIQDITI